LDDLLAPALGRDAVLGQHQREHDQGDELAGVGLGRGDADLGTCVDVDTAVRFPVRRKKKPLIITMLPAFLKSDTHL
jgi:hypothetical protein